MIESVIKFMVEGFLVASLIGSVFAFFHYKEKFIAWREERQEIKEKA